MFKPGPTAQYARLGALDTCHNARRIDVAGWSMKDWKICLGLYMLGCKGVTNAIVHQQPSVTCSVCLHVDPVLFFCWIVCCRHMCHLSQFLSCLHHTLLLVPHWFSNCTAQAPPLLTITKVSCVSCCDGYAHCILYAFTAVTYLQDQCGTRQAVELPKGQQYGVLCQVQLLVQLCNHRTAHKIKELLAHYLVFN